MVEGNCPTVVGTTSVVIEEVIVVDHPVDTMVGIELTGE